MLKWLLAPLGLFLCLNVEAATKWCSQSGSGTADGSSAANACAFTTANVLTAFGGSLTRGDTLYVCGQLSGSAVWAPGGVGGASGYFTISGNATDSGCTAGGWDMSSTGGIPIAIGGGGRSFIKVYSLYFRNCASNCLTFAGTDNVLDSITIDTSGDSAIRTTLAASRLSLIRSDVRNWGNNNATAEGGWQVEPADGVAVSTITVGGSAANANYFYGNGTGRYGVACYPAGASLNNGTASGCEISYNIFAGSYSANAINCSRDSDNCLIQYNDLSRVVAGGGAVIHTGGQGTYGSCTFTTDNPVIRGNIVTGGTVNAVNPSDGAGIYPDECTVNPLVLFNVSYGNDVACYYVNDVDGGLFVGNVGWDCGDNAFHGHGAGANLKIYNNSWQHNATASGVADQGTDGIQLDATLGTGTEARNNIIVCGTSTPKCFDADVSITESYNDIFTAGSTRAEGFTPDATDKNESPGWLGGDAPTTAAGMKLSAGSGMRRAGLELNLGNLPDNGNRAFAHPPSIGAWEADIASARTQASRTQAGIRTNASARTSR